MRSLPLLFGFIMMVALAGQGRARIIATESYDAMQYTENSVAIVDGRPAVAWVVPGNTRVNYVRALDADGAEWGYPGTVFTGPPSPLVAGQITLRVVNGRPVVFFRLPGRGTVQYCRANDATGAEWAAPVDIATGTTTSALSMEIVNGNPAIAFTADGWLKYVNALDADGTVWGSVRNIFRAQPSRPSLQVVDGRPAVSYADGANASSVELWYSRAADAAGQEWPVQRRVGQGQPRGMQVAGGVPVILWQRITSLMYSRAMDAEGTEWAPAVEIAQNAAGRLAMVNEKPAAVIWAQWNPLRYATALDSTGETWGPEVTLEDANLNTAPSLLAVNGRPAVVFPDRYALKFVRKGADGWPPELRVQFQTTVIQDGGPVTVGSNTRVGTTAAITLTLRNLNAGSEDLRIQSLIFDGPDAAEFRASLAPGSSSTLPAGGSTTMEVVYAPVRGGTKSAMLHIVTNSESFLGPFDLTLTGFSNPVMEVRRASGRAMPENAAFYLPPLPAGESADYSFSIANSGAADLTPAFTIGGTDSGEFSIVNPVSAVPPGGTETFTLRHTSTRSGSKTASLRITHNIPPLFDPFDLGIAAGAGTPDVSFIATAAVSAGVTALALNGDDSIVVATSAATLTKFRPDGTVDPSFFPPVLTGGNPLCLAALYDGKILIGGSFTSVNGHPRRYLARLEPDGLLDESFTAALPDAAAALAVQPDGKILAAGGVNIQLSLFIVRLLPDGAPDSSFTAVPDGLPSCIALQDDGRLLAGGGFSSINAVHAPGLARLDPDGTAHAFGSPSGPSWVDCFAAHADGRVMAGGLFTPDNLALLQPDGTRASISALDRLGSDRVLGLAVQADGAWLLGRFPVTASGTGGVSRLHSGGLFDDQFLSIAFSSRARVTNVRLQADGKVLAAADSRVLQAELGFIPLLHRLHNDPAITTLAVEAPGTLRWRRGGTAPEVTGVLFHARPEGTSEWTLLGKGTRFPGGWELSGLTLPSTGHLRAIGRAGASVMETVIPVPGSVPSPLELWRLQYFQTPDNTGNAADNADPDNDGLTNFTEFAFGLDPLDRASASLPAFTHNGTAFTVTFTIPDGRDDILYRADWTPDLTAGSWTAIPDTGTGRTHVFTLPATGQRAFVRFVIQR